MNQNDLRALMLDHIKNIVNSPTEPRAVDYDYAEHLLDRLIATVDLDARIDTLDNLPIAGKLNPASGLRIDHVPAEVVRKRLLELQERRHK